MQVGTATVKFYIYIYIYILPIDPEGLSNCEFFSILILKWTSRTNVLDRVTTGPINY